MTALDVVAALAWVVFAGTPPAPDCPQHAEHQKRGVDARHDTATGVAHTASVHSFALEPQGGSIRFEVLDPADTAGRDRIRAHLSVIARDFKQGRFDLPAFIHGRTPPGVPVLQRLKSVIHYRHHATERGGRVEIRTEDAEALAAVHAFLRFQIEDHGTHDPLDVRPLP